MTGDGSELIRYQQRPHSECEAPAPATEPPAPKQIGNSDELYLTGLHIEQYRHATWRAEDYWREALRRDPGDARSNNAMGLWHLRRGEFAQAEEYFRNAIRRLTSRNPNPYDGEPYYNLGLTLRFRGNDSEAYAAFYKATWNYAWRAAAYQAIAELDARRGNWSLAWEHLELSLRSNADNLNARNLTVVVMRKLCRAAEADALLRETLALDPLDCWARYLKDQSLPRDNQTRIDLALDHATSGTLPGGGCNSKSLRPPRKRRVGANCSLRPGLPSCAIGESCRSSGMLCARRPGAAGLLFSQPARGDDFSGSRYPDQCTRCAGVLLSWLIAVRPRGTGWVSDDIPRSC